MGSEKGNMLRMPKPKQKVKKIVLSDNEPIVIRYVIGGGKYRMKYPKGTKIVWGAEVQDKAHIIVGWGRKGWGFGEVTFIVKDGKLICDSELMGRDFIKKVLVALVDQSEFVCEKEKE